MRLRISTRTKVTVEIESWDNSEMQLQPPGNILHKRLRLSDDNNLGNITCAYFWS